MMEIKIPFKTPTINHLYWHKGNMKIITKEGREIRGKIYDIIINLHMNTTSYEDKKLSIKVEIFENWLTKKGLVKRADISNREKFLVDSIFTALGLEDKFIFEHKMIKKQSEEEYCIVTIDIL